MPWSLQSEEKKSKSHLASIDFNNIDVRDVKYLPYFLNGNILFSCPMWHLEYQVCMVAKWSMDKMCDSHPWCTT